MNPLFKLSTVVVALGIVLGLAAGPLRAAPESSGSAAPPVEIKMDGGTVRRRVPTSISSSGLMTITSVSRVKLHPHYVEIVYYDYYERTLVILREDFVDLGGKVKS